MKDSTDDIPQIKSETWRVTPDLLCILDPDGSFRAVNPAWHATLGWTPEDMVGRHFSDFLYPDDIAPSEKAFKTLTGGQPVLRFENRYNCRSGGQRWLSWVAVPEGELYVCSVRDVTDDKRRLEVIERQRSEAELREQFLAVLGHDLRNPLGAVDAGVRILMRREQDEASVDVLNAIRGSVGRMSELVDNLMDLARGRAGNGLSVERRADGDLRATLAQVIQEQGASSGAEFETDFGDLSDIYCDPARIGQLVSNLLSNAVEHGASGRPVKVFAGRRADRFVLSVANEGEPISAETMRHLFQPFFRQRLRRSQNGLGLGLFIASEIAKAHGGALSVDSGPDRTVFTLDMPAK